jgi:hypothetical protein
VSCSSRIGETTGWACFVVGMWGLLIYFQEVVSAYRFKSVEKRAPMLAVVQETFPLILAIGSRMLETNNEEAGAILHKVLKCYYACIQYELSAGMSLTLN